MRPLEEYKSVNDSAFSFLIEEVDFIRVESDLDIVLRSCGRARTNSCGKRDIFASEVEVSFSAHHFGDIDSTVDDTGSSVREVHFLIVNAFRSYAESNVFADIVSEFVSNLSFRDNDLEFFTDEVFGVSRAEFDDILTVFFFKNGVDEVHLR